MSLKNIQLINAEEVSNLFQTKYDTSSFIGVLSGDKQIDLATATSSTNKIVQGEQLEIKIGTKYTIELNEYQQDIIVELRDLGWGLLLFINEEAHYLRVNRASQESEFEAIKNYPTLKIVDFGSGKNEVIKNLDSLVNLKHLQTLNLDHCPALIDLNGLNQLTTIETLFLDGFSVESEFHHLAYLKFLREFSQNESTIKELNHLKDLNQLIKLHLFNCKSLSSLEGISGLTNLTSLNLNSCSSLISLEGISGLTNLTSLNLNSCSSLTSLEVISGLTNLSSLILESCVSLTSLTVISGLTNLTSLNLSWCGSLKSLEGISGLTNLTSLNLRLCRSLKSIEGISGLTNLTSLDLRSCQSLTNLKAISDFTKLTSLDLVGCKSLTNLEGISGLLNLSSLNLNQCSSLTSIEGISGLTNLTTLDLGLCESLKSLEEIFGLTNLTSLNLSWCGSLTSLEGISNLTNLILLNLSGCSSLKSLEWISGLINLTSLELNDCVSLTSLEGVSSLSMLTKLNLRTCISLKNLKGISGLFNLTSLDMRNCSSLNSLDGISAFNNLTLLLLSRCESIVFIKKIVLQPKLQVLWLDGCPNIRDFEELINCPNLKEVSWIHQASCFYILTGSAVRRKDQIFIEEKIECWINDLQFSKDPIVFANELIAAVSLIENQSLAKEQFIHLARVMRERGLADGGNGNAFTATTWELWVEAVMKQSDAFQEILELTTQNIDAERELEVVVTPILTALADITMLYPSAKEWAINFVKEIVSSFKENEDWARTIAPAAAVFYAGMELQEEVTFWLNKGTHPHIPKWKDTILLALVNYFAPKNQFSEARKYQQQISLPDVQDQARVALVKAMSASLPKEALDEFSNINDFILQTSLAKQLALEPSMLQSSEGVYQLLLCLEQTPELFSEFVANVLEKQPSSQFVQSIEALFTQPSETISLTLEFVTLCDNPEVIEFVGQRRIEKLKEELKGSEMEERTILLSTFMSLLVAKNLLNIEESNELQQILITQA